MLIPLIAQFFYSEIDSSFFGASIVTVIFGTLFVFGLMGLVVGILSDLMYVFVDPRIDFERREG